MINWILKDGAGSSLIDAANRVGRRRGNYSRPAVFSSVLPTVLHFMVCGSTRSADKRKDL